MAYLDAALDLPDGIAGVFEIGGPEVVPYGKLIALRSLLHPEGKQFSNLGQREAQLLRSLMKRRRCAASRGNIR